MTAPSLSPAQGQSEKRLSPKEKRALREQARRAVLAEEKARIAAARAPERAATPAAPVPAASSGSEPPAPPPTTTERTDDDRVKDAAAMLSGVLFPLLSLCALPFGYHLALDEFTDAKALEDAKSWVPLLRRYRWLDLACTWVGMPARLIRRVRELARPRSAPPAEKKTEGGRVVPMERPA